MTSITTNTTASSSSFNSSNSSSNDQKVATSIFLTIQPNQLSDIALILKTPIKKSLSSSTASTTVGENENDNGTDHDHYHEAVITNNDLLQARNKGKVQINNSPLLRVYPSYRNESVVNHYKNYNSSSKLSYPSLVALVIPAALLLSAVASFFIVVDSTVPDPHYEYLDGSNNTCSDGDGDGDGDGVSGVAGACGTTTISGWDAIFPSYHTTPIVMKLTVWGTLIAIVAYEQSHFWYGSGGRVGGSGRSSSDYYFYGNKAKPIGVEVIVDCSSNSISSINGMDGRTTATMGQNSVASAGASAGDGTNVATSTSRGLTIDADHNSSTGSTSSTMTSGTPKRSNSTAAGFSKTTPTGPFTPPQTEAKSLSSSPPPSNSTSPKNQAIPSIQKSKSEDPPESMSVMSKMKNSSSSSSNNISSNSNSTPNTNTPSSASSPNTNAITPSSSSKSPQTIPFRFIRATKGDMKAARTRWAATLAWRNDLGMDTILSSPHPKIHTIKRNYPHYFHLRGKKNECCYYEKPPKMNLTELKKDGVNLDELLRHYAICCEYMWTEIEPTEEGKSIYVIDLDGIGIRDFAGEVVDFVKRASSFTGEHYPERSGSIYVINVPSWFSVIWNVVKPMVDDVTKKKITIMRYGKEAITKALMEKIEIENIPPEYGGKSMPLGQSPEEVKFMEHFAKLNNGN